MSVGPPLLWMPLFLLVTGLVAAGRLLGIDYPLDGFGWVFQASAGYSGIIMATAGVWISYRLAARYFDRATAIWSTLAIWLASSALYYSGISPTYSHSASMLVVSAFLYVWATSIGRQTAGRYALVGLLAGFVALVRWQDAIFLVVPLADAIWHVLRPIEAEAGTPAIARLGRAFVRLAVCGVAAIVAFAPQMLVWMVLYGSPLTICTACSRGRRCWRSRSWGWCPSSGGIDGSAPRWPPRCWCRSGPADRWSSGGPARPMAPGGSSAASRSSCWGSAASRAPGCEPARGCW